jgi:large conductance mechanosensitive channel
MTAMLKEFRDFAMRGNVIDLAVGIVIGAAFTAIVNSLVGDVLMPVLGVIIGGVDFADFFIVLSPLGESYPTLAAAQAAGASVLAYGLFLNAVVSFLIVAFAIFILVKNINRLRRKQDEAPEEAPPPPRNEVLLAEIRDLLKERRA